MDALYSVTHTPQGNLYHDTVEQIDCPIHADMNLTQIVTLPDIDMDAPSSNTLVETSIHNPINSARLRDIAADKKTAAIIVSDATRGVATAQVLPFLIQELETAGIQTKNITAVVAVGVHRDASTDEMQTMLGPYRNRIRIVNHHPFDPKNLIEIGTTSRGNTIEVNRTVHEADIRIGIGKVEPHEFAGYSGGRKSVLPGVASEKTILHNHRPEMLSDPKAAPCVLPGNPVHLDMLEAAQLLRVDFFVNLVQNARGTPVAAFSGDIVASHAAAVSFLEKHYGIDVAAEANVFLTTPGVPLNIDFYQAVKPLFGLYPVLKQNDVIVLYAACREGVNSVDMPEPFRHGRTPEEVIAHLTANYRIQMDQALLLCRIYRKNVRIVVHSPGVSDADLRLMLMHPATSLSNALEQAARLKRQDGEQPRLCVFPQAQRAVIRVPS